MEIRKILVPLDGSETSLKSLRNALDLAGKLGASVIGLHVFTKLSGFTAVHAIVIEESKWPAHVRDIMVEARKIANQSKTKYVGLVIGGMAAGYDIVTFADSKKNAIDLIMMARRGMYFPREAFPGSTTIFEILK